jgi:cell division protease FtsH
MKIPKIPRAAAVILMILAGYLLAQYFDSNQSGERLATLSYSDFVDAVKSDKVERVEFEERVAYGILKKADKADSIPTTLSANEKLKKSADTNELSEPIKVKPTAKSFTFKTLVAYDAQLMPLLLDKRVQIVIRPPKEQSILPSILFSFGPMLVFLAVYWYMMKKMQGGGGGGGGMKIFSFGKSPAKLIRPDENKVKWDDVRGVDEAKADLQEIVEFLKHPDKFKDVGGKIPKGVLLSGGPGCGKTHLSRALANEAGANFFTLSGADFVEMFVGVGASRVRDLFEQARKSSPAIIFIDEIDAVGRQRGSGQGGSDEREQTLNALLVEMDGFDQTGGVIVIAATNRPEILDSALLRPGRFDRQIVVPSPDMKGREDILGMYVKKIPLAADVSVSVIARGTPGFSGADLANLVNESALFTARRNKKFVEMSDFESAKDKIIMGAERRIASMTDEDKKNTAYHEAGHAVIGMALPDTDPVHKVTIVPRGRALGVTLMIPEKDQYGQDREQLLQQISMLFGGRLAEEMFLGSMSTGASDDIRRATMIATKMVTELGMSRLGPVRYVRDENAFSRHWSESKQMKIDEEVEYIIDRCYMTAKSILESHKEEMHKMASMLLEKETISGDDCRVIMGEKLRKWRIEPQPLSRIDV